MEKFIANAIDKHTRKRIEKKKRKKKKTDAVDNISCQ